MAEPAGRSPRAGVRVTVVLGDPLAPKSFSLIAIHKHGLPHVFSSEVIGEAQASSRQPLSRDSARI
jgi:ribonuclease R